MQTPQSEDWTPENIPNDAFLFYRVPIASLKNPGGKMHPAVFKENKGGMSTDWDRYSTALKTLERIEESRRVNFHVIKLSVDYIRQRRSLGVVHSPDVELNNRSHTDVLGVDTKDGEPLNQDDRKENKDYLFDMYSEWVWEE